MNNNHDNEKHAFNLNRDDIPKEELEDGILQETPGAIVDCKLIISRQNTLKKYTSKSVFICFYHSHLYDYTPWLLLSNKTLFYSLMHYNIIDTKFLFKLIHTLLLAF